jgi:hypothetical protein
MPRTFAYIISLLLLSSSVTFVQAQDTIPIPLKIRIGFDVSGPLKYYSDKNIRNLEGFIAVDLNEKRTVVLAAGHLDYKYSQYNYTYLSNGSFVKAGIDFNLLKADKSQGKYWAGIGLKYGLSRFTTEVPFLEKENYWGTETTSLPIKSYWGHFLEVSPGIRAELFKNISLGWSINVRMLLHSGTGKDLKPVYFPGFGDGTKTVSTGINYYLIWSIRYKKINAIMKKEAPEETDDTYDKGTTCTSGTSGTSGNSQQGKIRQ